jgi:hypothetical protein
MTYSRFVIGLLLGACLLALLAQIAIGFDSVNIAAASIVFASSAVVLLYLLWTPALRTHPLSTFALLGFCVTTQMGALLVQSVTLTPIAYNLRDPLLTFGLLAAFQATALLMHVAHRWLLAPGGGHPDALPRRALAWLGVYDAPGTGTLWLMGWVGLVSLIASAGGDSPTDRVLQGIAFLTWAPYLIVMFLLRLGPAYCRPLPQLVKLALYSVLIVLLGVATNSRQVMLLGFTTVGLFALLMVLRSDAPLRWRRVGQVAGVFALLGVLAIPAAQLATAMVAARDAREQVGTGELVVMTMRYAMDPQALAEVREQAARQVLARYDEHYFANPLVARFVETKFHDNAFYFASTLTAADRAALADTTLRWLWVILPQPAIDALGLDIDKADFQFSIGDYLAHLSHGGPLGGYRTGSALAEGLALMGAGFFVLYAGLCLLMYALADLLARRGRGDEVAISAVGMLLIWELFINGVTNESLHSWLAFVLRMLPQALLFFVLLLAVARVAGALGASPQRAQPGWARPAAAGRQLLGRVAQRP